MRRRLGYTLIEVLVTVMVIGVLAGLVLVGVQAARGSARRLQCSANLRQIGLAMNAYLAREGVFPSAMPRVGRSGVGCNHSPFVRILPELEQTPRFDAMNFSVHQSPWEAAPENATALRGEIGVFLCPADAGGWESGMGMTNYRVNLGSGWGNFPPRHRVGAFSLETWTRPAHFTDGMARTALVSERLRGDGNAARWDRRRDYWYADTDREDLAGILDDCNRLVDGPRSHNSAGGSSWALFGYDRTFYNHILPPNSRRFDCSLNSFREKRFGGEDAGIHAARGWHSGGVEVGFADGSVRSVRATIAVETWRALGTRAGGEAIAFE